MTKPQIEAEIATAQAKIKSLRDRADKTWSAWHGAASAERKSMEATYRPKVRIALSKTPYRRAQKGRRGGDRGSGAPVQICRRAV